jgi:flavin reductase (DIM6/NTAB) family NADH-FMN oxidoreductase RutF
MTTASPPQLPRRLRDAAGRFATGVTIVTTVADDRIHGMTANGFMSVSLRPALVVVSVGNASRMKSLLEASRVYGVSVLSVEQQELSAHFAGAPAGSPPVEFVEAGGAPLVDGALAHIAAEVVDGHPAGDHTLFIGEVKHVDVRPGKPLVFHGGSYRALLPEYEWSAVWDGATDWM